MPRVYHQKARKDYPKHGIKKGDMYYSWSIKTGPVSGQHFRSLTPPKPSQLTNSEFKQNAYEIKEELSNLSLGDEGSIEDRIEAIKGDIDEIISRAEELRNETQEKLDNMPEGLQQGSTGELLQERIDAVESFISELEGAKDNAPDQEDDESEEDYEVRVDDWLGDEIKSISISV